MSVPIPIQTVSMSGPRRRDRLEYRWNPWHGCRKLSAGCLNCYVYRIDERHGRDPSQVSLTRDFEAPLKRKRDGSYRIPPGALVWTCFSSDFLLEDADEWRREAFRMMRERTDLYFFFITKRIDRLADCIPEDWGDGYENVHICCTVENQDRADYRLPIFLQLPIAHRSIACEPLLEGIELRPYLDGGAVMEVVAGGESGAQARICRYEWVRSLREQCEDAGVGFAFRQTGANFERNGRVYRIPRTLQYSQARRAGLNFLP